MLRGRQMREQDGAVHCGGARAGMPDGGGFANPTEGGILSAGPGCGMQGDPGEGIRHGPLPVLEGPPRLLGQQGVVLRKPAESRVARHVLDRHRGPSRVQQADQDGKL